MIDFTSSLYLAMKHSSDELRGWNQFTNGVPAALFESMQSEQVSEQVANMQGLEKGICAPSTLHLYWDLFGFLSQQQIVVFVDDHIYPVSKYGIERLMINGTSIYSFRHLDANHLAELVSRKTTEFKIPVVLTDGWCPQCGKPAPINYYSEILKPYAGNIIIDDTQAFGIFGERITKTGYGNGGGGILKWLNVHDKNIITITSLAKAFGVPMAVLCASAVMVSAFKNDSETRVYSSPVSIAHLSAASNALMINRNTGEQRRGKLLRNILLIKNELKQSGIKLNGKIFPVQSIIGLHHEQINDLFKKLYDAQFKLALVAEHLSKQPAISFVIRCDHSAEEILLLSDAIRQFYPHGQRMFF